VSGRADPPPEHPGAHAPSPRPQGAAAGRRGGLLPIVRIAYLVLLAAVVVWLVGTRRQELARLVAGTRPALLATAFALSFGQMVVGVAFWTSALRALEVPARWATVGSATARSVPARYIPGSVWYAVGRIGLLRAEGMPGRALAAVALLELAVSGVVVFGLGMALLLAAGRVPGGAAGVAVVALGLGAAASPPVVNRLIAWFARWRGGHAVAISWRRYGRLFAWMLLFWLWSSTTFTVYLHAFPEVRVTSVLEVAGSFMVAWGIGYLAVFAPQGMGVFEVTVAALLADTAIGGVAVIAGGYRALMAVRDAVLFGGAGLARAIRRPPRTAPAAGRAGEGRRDAVRRRARRAVRRGSARRG
jgi:glycosyltransferase 2 family protein